MIAYIRCRKIFAIYLEFSRAWGPRPFFRLKTCNGESIMDIPYGQIIITPGKILRSGNRVDWNEKRDRNTAAFTARTAEDRS